MEAAGSNANALSRAATAVRDSAFDQAGGAPEARISGTPGRHPDRRSVNNRGSHNYTYEYPIGLMLKLFALLTITNVVIVAFIIGEVVDGSWILDVLGLSSITGYESIALFTAAIIAISAALFVMTRRAEQDLEEDIAKGEADIKRLLRHLTGK